MSIQDQFNAELSARDIRIPDEARERIQRTISYRTGDIVLWDRLQNGCRDLDTQQTDRRWDLFHALLIGWQLACAERVRRRREIEAEETHRLQHDPIRQNERRRLASINNTSLRAYLAHEAKREDVPQVAATSPNTPQPTLVLRQRGA